VKGGEIDAVIALAVPEQLPVLTECSGHDMLAQLLIEASASFETDRRRAKSCIKQATELLQARQNPEERRQVEFPIVRGGLALWQARRVAAYIESNICSRIHTADLARLVHLSVGHFHRAFRLSFGETPLAYVMRQRIVRAQVIMARSKEPLAQVALDCGMCDQAHFSRTFRRIVGVNPNVWRRQFSAGSQTVATSGSQAGTPVVTLFISDGVE
jgi:AraC family transcriptional regulator